MNLHKIILEAMPEYEDEEPVESRVKMMWVQFLPKFIDCPVSITIDGEDSCIEIECLKYYRIVLDTKGNIYNMDCHELASFPLEWDNLKDTTWTKLKEKYFK